MSRGDGAGGRLTTRKGTRACAAELSSGYGMDGGSVGEAETMSAAYSGCAVIGSGHGDEESRGVDGASRTGEGATGAVSTRLGIDENASAVSSGADGAQGTSRYGASGAGESREGETRTGGESRTGGRSGERDEGHEAMRRGHARTRLVVPVSVSVVRGR